jgi:putative oxidoreductase
MRRVAAIVGRLALAAVFLWAAYTKLRDPWMVFAMEIDAMHIVPGTAVELAARTMPWFELMLGVLLVTGIQMRYVATVATALLVCFFSVLLFLYFKGFQGDCGCFGPGEQLGPKTLARDGALVALSLWVTWDAFRRSKCVRLRDGSA